MTSSAEYYGEDYGRLVAMEKRLVGNIETYMLTHSQDDDEKAVAYYTSRIKSPESLSAKLQKAGLGQAYEDALAAGFHDIVGARVVCAFVDDVYDVADWICSLPDYEEERRKDYIKDPKDNGYRSLHLILRCCDGVGDGRLVELQLRTIAMDWWSTLEHKLKYKKEIKDEQLVKVELKRCSDQIASLDIDMLTIRDMLRADE